MAVHKVPILDKLSWQDPVEDKDLTSPPGSPSKGDRYIVGASATGDWSGHDGDIVYYDGSSWQFISEVEGMAVYVKDEDAVYVYITSWIILADNSTREKGVCIAQVESDTDVAVADGKIAFTVPLSLDGMNLVDAIASVHTKGVTGTTDIQIRRRRAGSDADMLSTKVTIGDEWFASDEVIDEANDDVLDGDQIYIDVDAVHSGTAPKGLSVVLTFRKP